MARKQRRRYGKKKQRIPIAATVGALGTANEIFNKPAVSLPYGQQYNPVSILTGKQTPKEPVYAFINSAVANASQPKVYLPLVVGGALSMVGKKLGLNKYMHKLPLVGKKVDL